MVDNPTGPAFSVLVAAIRQLDENLATRDERPR